MQTKRGSLIETVSNVIIGLVISLLVNAVVFPLLGFELTGSQNIVLTIIYTIISIVRSYILRRAFNRISIKYGI